MRPPPELACPRHLEALACAGRIEELPELLCPRGCAFPVRGGVPRFVEADAYAQAFGVQWNAFPRTQLDSYTGTTISRDRLTRCFGGSLGGVRGRSVLEVGCGAGRFTEILLDAGASVFACDLSSAVEANHANCARDDGYFVCQADVRALPARRGAFDYVVALGMIQHTPSPEDTILALATALRPGGELVVDHYRPLPSMVMRTLAGFAPRSLLRRVLVRLPPRTSLLATTALTRTLLPLHRALWRRGPVVDTLRAGWRAVSPVYDYYDSYPELGAHLDEWALLDTYDGLTDRYKHLRTPDEVAAALIGAGLQVLECRTGGNGVEARARRAA